MGLPHIKQHVRRCLIEGRADSAVAIALDSGQMEEIVVYIVGVCERIPDLLGELEEAELEAGKSYSVYSPEFVALKAAQKRFREAQFVKRTLVEHQLWDTWKNWKERITS